MAPVGNDVCLVFNDPLNDLSLFEFHSFSDCRWKVDVVLIGRFLPLYALDFRWVSHGEPPMHRVQHIH